MTETWPVITSQTTATVHTTNAYYPLLGRKHAPALKMNAIKGKFVTIDVFICTWML